MRCERNHTVQSSADGNRQPASPNLVHITGWNQKTIMILFIIFELYSQNCYDNAINLNCSYSHTKNIKFAKYEEVWCLQYFIRLYDVFHGAVNIRYTVYGIRSKSDSYDAGVA